MTTENVKETCRMADNSSYQIHAFMRNQLHLKNNELLVYAVIYSFTTKSTQGYYFGSREYMSACIGADIRTVDRTIKSLMKKGLIFKKVILTMTGRRVTYTSNVNVIQRKDNQEESINDHDKMSTVANCQVENFQNLQTECHPVQTNFQKIQTDDVESTDRMPPNKDRYQLDKKKNKKKIANEGDTSAVGGQASEVNQSGVPKTPLASNNQTGNTNSSKKFQPPTLQEVTEYFEANELKADPEDFYYYYDAIGWYKGKNKIVNWKSAVHSWVKKQSQFEDKSKDEEEETEGGKEYYDIYSDPDFHFGEVPPDRRF